MLVKLLDLLFLRKLLQPEKKDDIVREDDDLPCLGRFDETEGHAFAPAVVERGHRIVEDDSRWVVSSAQFGEKRSNG